MVDAVRSPEQAVARTDGFLPIEQDAAIGDGRSLALVGRDGAVDWMCAPDLDSSSVFGALLDPESGGEFVLCPSDPFTVSRRYVERTNVLETTFRTDRGEVQVLDALTFDKSQADPSRELVRQVSAIAGTVSMRWRVHPRMQFGKRSASLHRHGPAIVARDGALRLCLRTWDAGQTEVREGEVAGAFELHEGQRATLAMLATEAEVLRIPDRAAIERRLRGTIERWRAWVARHSYEGPWTAVVERSLLAIGLLADARSGAIAAAGTSSLPEVLGGQRNYDYRFGWVRDLCFTVDALLAVGMDELGASSIGWLLRATRHTHPRIDPVYALGGDVVRSQHELALRGYRGTRPVYVGNSAGSQLQLGGFGDFIETIAVCAGHDHFLFNEVGERLADAGDLLTRIWRSEDSGLWELPDRAHYGTSKLGCWVAFDRLLELVRKDQAPARNVELWRSERDAVYRFIEDRLFSARKNSYLMKADDDALDCGMLLAARRGFGSPQRINGTIDAISRELRADGPLFYRYSGMQHEENAFLACTFWMVEAMAIAGRREEAAELMDAGAASLCNDVGLFSEQMEPRTRAMRGNFPQALTHLALIRAAHELRD